MDLKLGAKRIKDLAASEGLSVNKLLIDELGLNKSVVDNMIKGSMPAADKLDAIANRFNVTTDYLLGKSDIRSPLEIPEILKNVPVAFHRGEFEDLTQDEVDQLARIAAGLKATRVQQLGPN